MTDSYSDDSHLDAAIDRAVRELMSAEPRTDLRERVLAELRGTPARAALWPRFAFGSAALAVATVAMLVLVDRPADRPVERVAVARPPAESPRREPAAPPLTVPAPADRTPVRGDVPKALRTPQGRAADRLVQAASIDPGEAIGIEPMAPIEPLTPIEPIRIARLEAPQVSAPPITIAPISISPIDITPLTPRR
jgi:hypothetical protein